MDKNSKFQAALKAESDIGKRIAMLAFDMSMAFNPYQAIRDWEVENETANEIAEAPIAAAAAKLGIPFAELQGKEEKTEEELAAIREAEEGLAQMHRAAFARTRYGRALLVLDALSSDPLPVGDEDTFPTSTEAVICFFALHPEINPREDAAIESNALRELVEIYDGLLSHTDVAAFLQTNYNEKISTFPTAKDPSITITQLPVPDLFAFPTAKALREQNRIAMLHGETAEIMVDGKGTLVRASITGRDGEEIGISREQIELQVVIGEMLKQNSFAPIRVTPAQIFRRYAGLSADAYVTPQQAKEIENHLDPLLATAASLDYTMHIERHKGIKRQHDYDYEQAHKKEGALVIGVKDTTMSVQYRGMTMRVVYTIYAAPMFYLYAHAVNQIGYANRKLLIGGGAAEALRKKNPNGHPDAKIVSRSVHTITLKRYLTQQVDRIKNSAPKVKGSPTRPYKENLTYDTIASAFPSIDTPKKMRQLREDVLSILSDFAAEGYIVAFDQYKKGRAYAGVTISVSSTPKSGQVNP